MTIGFTGTRHGMTLGQRYRLKLALAGFAEKYGRFEFHHGDCVGADERAHEYAREVGAYLIIHPPKDSSFRARVKYFDSIRLPKHYLSRNEDIVDECDVLIACPEEDKPQKRGGTWYTVRYAEKMKRKTLIIWPDGRMQTVNP